MTDKMREYIHQIHIYIYICVCVCLCVYLYICKQHVPGGELFDRIVEAGHFKEAQAALAAGSAQAWRGPSGVPKKP